MHVKQTGTGRHCLFRALEADDFGKNLLFTKRQFVSSIGNTREPHCGGTDTFVAKTEGVNAEALASLPSIRMMTYQI
jgi:hypothetical protein